MKVAADGMVTVPVKAKDVQAGDVVTVPLHSRTDVQDVVRFGQHAILMLGAEGSERPVVYARDEYVPVLLHRSVAVSYGYVA